MKGDTVFQYPTVGVVYLRKSDPSCKLKVEEVNERDSLGREVVGIILHPGHEDHGLPFAARIDIFHSSFVMKNLP